MMYDALLTMSALNLTVAGEAHYDAEDKYQEAHEWFMKAAKKGHLGAESKLRTFGNQYK